jgi:hypothetical protein
MHDPRLGRFFKSDPKEQNFVWQSTYVFASNNPIQFIDLNGENSDDPKVKSQTIISSSIDSQNHQIVQLSKIREKKEISNGIRTTTTTLSTMNTDISPLDKVKSNSSEVTVVNNVKVETYNKKTGKWELSKENVNKYQTTINKSQFSTVDIQIHSEWISLFESFKKNHDEPFNKYVQESIANRVNISYSLGLVPLSISGISLNINIPDNMKKAISAIGIPTSVSSGLQMASSKMISNNYQMVHSISSFDNSIPIKIGKTPTSKDDHYVGPSSWQDLFDASKWAELLNGH